MYTCTRCGATGTSGFHKDPNNWREGKYVCDACYNKQAEAQKKAWGCLFSAIGWLIKALGKVVKALGKVVCKLITNKWVWTIFSCGLAWVAWKVLDKIYAPKD